MSEDPDKGSINRRAILGIGAAAVAGYAAYRGGVLERLIRAPEFDFQTLANPPGYRLIKSGPITSGGVPLFGLDTEKPAGLKAAEQQIDADLCGALFGNAPMPGTVPLAYFYDYQCPICRRLTPALRELDGVSVVWHDLAGLGPASEIAARAAIAARAQGGFDAFHDRLMRARFQATEGYVASLAESIGIDPDRLLADMASAKTTARLWQSQALANRFGLIGTPGLVLGRTVVLGNITATSLQRLVALEASTPPLCT